MTGKHHPDCDGFRFHVVNTRTTYGPAGGPAMYRADCPLCGELPGLAGSAGTVRSINSGHERSEECSGQCLAW